MTPNARAFCQLAVADIHAGDYATAIANLRIALHGTRNPRAWSKLMLALRALSRIEVQS